MKPKVMTRQEFKTKIVLAIANNAIDFAKSINNLVESNLPPSLKGMQFEMLMNSYACKEQNIKSQYYDFYLIRRRQELIADLQALVELRKEHG